MRKTTQSLTKAAALDLLTSNQRIVAGMAAAEPTAFFEALASHAKALEGLRVYCANPTKLYPCFSDPSLNGRLELLTMFLTPSVRARHGHGVVHYLPQHLSRWTKNILAEGPIDIYWGSCTPPDERGFVSLGTGACYEPEVLRAARLVVLEVNPSLPVTFGATAIPLACVDYLVDNPHDLPEQACCEPDAIDHRIGAFVADLVTDGATIQLGIGAIPNAVGEALAEHCDLGVHSEMLNDAMMRLYEKGVITGAKKTLWPGKLVGAFIWGTRRLYDFAHANPLVELHPGSLVNDPYVIGQNQRMVSINSAIEIDVTGQCCSESVGHREISGVGGAAETHIGAQRSSGGRGIIALRSQAKDGASKIVFELKPGAKVSISRNDIDTVVTEYGVARLAGRSVSQRVQALVGIAHPSVRDELLAAARREAYI